jgi:hypothetical protein
MSLQCTATPCIAAIQCRCRAIVFAWRLLYRRRCMVVVVLSSLHGGDSDTRAAVCHWTPTPGAHPIPPHRRPCRGELCLPPLVVYLSPPSSYSSVCRALSPLGHDRLSSLRAESPPHAPCMARPTPS